MSATIGTTLDVRMPQAAPPSGELALLIRAGDYHVRIVRIRARPSPRGSAPPCSRGLSAARVRPLHDIIVRGQASVNSIAAIDEPCPAQPAESSVMQAERQAWNRERESLLSQIGEKEQLTQRLEATLDELQKAVQCEKASRDDAAQRSELHQ